MQIKATEMEGMRLDLQRWVTNFNSQVLELEQALSNNGDRASATNTREQTNATAITDSQRNQQNQSFGGFPLRLKVLKEQL